MAGRGQADFRFNNEHDSVYIESTGFPTRCVLADSDEQTSDQPIVSIWSTHLPELPTKATPLRLRGCHDLRITAVMHICGTTIAVPCRVRPSPVTPSATTAREQAELLRRAVPYRTVWQGAVLRCAVRCCAVSRTIPTMITIMMTPWGSMLPLSRQVKMSM